MNASLQIVASLPSATASLFPVELDAKLDRTPNRFREAFARGPIHPVEGWLRMVDRRGLGVEGNDGLMHRSVINASDAR